MESAAGAADDKQAEDTQGTADGRGKELAKQDDEEDRKPSAGDEDCWAEGEEVWHEGGWQDEGAWSGYGYDGWAGGYDDDWKGGSKGGWKGYEPGWDWNAWGGSSTSWTGDWWRPADDGRRGKGGRSSGKGGQGGGKKGGKKGVVAGGAATGYGSHSDEMTARVHFNKTYQVLSEILAAHPAAFDTVNTFVDLGSAPGGFSSRLLDQCPIAQGLGVTLPVLSGGFPMMLTHPRLRVECCDLLTVTQDQLVALSPGGAGGVDVCMADAQDLGRRTNKQAPTPGVTGSRGVGAACAVLGIWALTIQELALALAVLRAGGTYVFRFGWRGKEAGAREAWYREATFALLCFVMQYFQDVRHMKSDFSHQADASFYIVAAGFQKAAFDEVGLLSKLFEAVDRIVTCERAGNLTWCLESMMSSVTPALRERSAAMLEVVGKLRAIGLATRRHVEVNGKASADAALLISPVPFHLTLQRLKESLERYGKIAGLKRRSHAVGVGADALVQFTQAHYAKRAFEAITELQILGPNITVKYLEIERGNS